MRPLSTLNIFVVLYSFVPEICSFSLLDRVNGKDIRTSIPDFRTSDADVGMRSAHFIGSFRGQPIKTRQHHAFIDDNGVPIPLLPYHEHFATSAESSSHHQKLKALAREHKILKWAKEIGGIAKKRRRRSGWSG
ncbi:uncharacterized protein CELE_Y53C12B.7 [Caenorhabditis elegans]|uniref:Secreted protein n=1 Tax=Caenorhabditis elegans TaxID=6239 RepID=Q7YWN6_CAEEL|nr:Secreted protein [Caenorhabditis elegans]CAE18037.1 Secreted protein [Caenorhabditis elegans]|eukprot:NP_001022465.1 Uncharacterized protein CELE_Y53C12B.7 [Caenorhabditis elegans]